MANADFESNFQSYILQIKESIKSIQLESTMKKTIEFLGTGVNAIHKYQNVISANLSSEALDQLTNAINSFGNTPDAATSIEGCLCDIKNSALQQQCKQMCTPLLENNTISQTMKDELIKGMMKAKEEMVCKMIVNGAYVSAVIFVVQGVNLYFTWKEISTASNVEKDSREKFPEIEEKIAELLKGSYKLTQLMIEFESADNKDNKIRMAIDVTFLTSSLNCTYADTKDLINNVKVKINGKIERIDLTANKCIVDGVGNGLQGAANLFQYLQLGTLATGPLKLLQGVVTFTFFALAAGNAAAYVVSKQILKNLRNTMEIIQGFEEQLKSIRVAVQKAEAWYVDRRREINFFNI